MADPQQRPYVDPQHLTDDEAGLYELVATFEYQGRPMTQEAISAATGLDGDTVAGMLRRLTERNVLVRSDTGGQPAYALARRDWSAAPGLRRHFPPGHGAGEQEPAGQMPGGASQAPQPDRPGRDAQRQEARARRVRAEHLRGEQERGEQARAELRRHHEPGGRGERPGTDDEGSADQQGAPGPSAGTTATEHLMAGPDPQGRYRDAPGTLIARADSDEERPTQARYVANAVPGKPDGEVDTRS